MAIYTVSFLGSDRDISFRKYGDKKHTYRGTLEDALKRAMRDGDKAHAWGLTLYECPEKNYFVEVGFWARRDFGSWVRQR